MNPNAQLDVILPALTVLFVATWLLLSGWASVALGDAIREHGGSRRAGLIAVRASFVLLGVGGAVLIQWVAL